MVNNYDAHNFFVKIDESGDSKLQKNEIEKNKNKDSIFTKFIEPDMTYGEFMTLIKTQTESDKNQTSLYKKESCSTAQPEYWETIEAILTKDQVDADRFNIKTNESTTIDPLLNFNNEDGKYMLKHLSFTDKTFLNTPKENLPENFDPLKIIEFGKNQGQNVDIMHEMGYTGKGIRCAIIDSPILTNHKEIKSSLVGYEAIGEYTEVADFHGQAVSGILVGDAVGIAPNSELIYFAASPSYDGRFEALKRIIDINKNSEEEDKIKVVSLSWGVDKDDPKYEEYENLIKQVTDSGAFVVTADFLTGDKYPYSTLEKKDPMANPNDFENYIATNSFGENKKTLFFVAGNRTVASAVGEDSYRHDSYGSTSWTVPAFAGIYACALQCANENGVELTPKKFQEYALETGQSAKDENGKIYPGVIVDAEALVKYIESLNPNK